MPLRFDVQWVTVAGGGPQPSLLIPREPVAGDLAKQKNYQAFRGDVWAPEGSVLPGGVPNWGVTRTGEYARVPIVAYRTAFRSVAAVLETGVEVGMSAVVSLRGLTRDEPQRATLLIGSDCVDLPEANAFRCFVGVALWTNTEEERHD